MSSSRPQHSASRNGTALPRRPVAVTVADDAVEVGPGGTWRRTWAVGRGILRQRCPRCRRGHIFRGLFRMNDPCPTCGLLFQREEGYFLGAMYISYGLSSAIFAVLYFTLDFLLPTWNTVLLALVTFLPYLPLVPAVFRYSRVLWIYFDRTADPNGGLSGSYEKMRLRQLAGRQARPDGNPPAGHVT